MGIRWAMLQKLPEDSFEWVEETSQFNEDFIKSYNKDSDKGYFLEVDVQYPTELHEFQNDLPILSESIKTGIVEKLVANSYYKRESIVHIKILKQALNQGLVLKNA